MARKKKSTGVLRFGAIPLLFAAAVLIHSAGLSGQMTGDKTGLPISPHSSVTSDTAEKRDTEQLDIHLYFGNQDNTFLSAEQRGVWPSQDPQKTGEAIIEALIKGPRRNLFPILPPETELRAVYIVEDGTAYVDFSDHIRQHHPGGAQSERMTIYAIINSLILNIPEISAVKILINGKDIETLKGHIDLRVPLKADMLLIR